MQGKLAAGEYPGIRIGGGGKMNKRPLLALVGAALVVIAFVLFILPSRSEQNPASANGPVEGQAQLSPSGKASQASDTSGVTTPPEPQPELEIEKLSAGQQAPQFVVI